MWAVRRLGIVTNKRNRQMAFGVGWKMRAYNVQVCIEAWIDGCWLNMGTVTALSPDTKWSRKKSANPPFLLGRNDFLYKFNVCFDEPNKTMRLRKVVNGAQAGRRQEP